MLNDLPHVSTELDFSSENPNSHLYLSLLKNNLLKILPPKFFELYKEGYSAKEELIEYFQSLFPISYVTTCNDIPANVSFIILYNYRSNASKFTYEMITRWLVPAKRMNVLMMYAVDFSFPVIGNQVYTLCEVVFRIESKEELEEVQRNLPIIESEICLGVVSSYYARRILEIKGLSSDEKTAMVQEYITYMTTRYPAHFSSDVFTEMQHVLIMCHDDFKLARNVRHLSRIICIKYLFRKNLRKAIREMPDKRHLSLKIFKATLNLKEEKKKILGIIVAVNFLRDNENFEETHLIKAIRNYIPIAQAVPSSFFFSRRGNEPICSLYLEIAKSDGTPFLNEEIQLLRSELPHDLEGRIERLMHPVFMPRNEEEVMRNILTLSHQVRYLRDIPQIFVSFDEQSHSHLFFTVILVRIIKTNTASIQELFARSCSFMEYIHDRCKTIGFLRKKYRKEATVFRLKFLKEQFLRRDNSIDLYKARQAVVSEISKVVGEVRDYNGGMISKQNELLSRVRELVKCEKKYNEVLLENFFYSLNPVIMRTVLDPLEMKKLFFMLLYSISSELDKEDGYAMDVRAEPEAVFVMIKAIERKTEEDLKEALLDLKIPSSALACSSLNFYDTYYIGYIYRCDDPLSQRKFCITLQQALEASKNLNAVNALLT